MNSRGIGGTSAKAVIPVIMEIISMAEDFVMS